MSMRDGVRAAAACAIGVLVAVALVFSTTVNAQKDQKDQKDSKQPKLDKTQTQQAQALAEALAQAESGAAVASDAGLTLETYHFFKTATGETYVPFTIAVDPKAVTSPSVVVLFRVVDRNAKPAVTTAKQDKKIEQSGAEGGDAAKPAAPRPFEQLSFTALKTTDTKPKAGDATPATATTDSQAQPLRLSRAFVVPAGEYDLYVSLMDRTPIDKKQKPKISMLKAPIVVPDFRAGDLTTSSVLVTESINQLPALLPPDQQRENPYTIGQLQIVPKVGTKFAKTQELEVYFQIYNAALDAASKPNVQVDYLFYRKEAAGEKRIAKTEPQILSAATLPPQFDVTKHQLAGGSGWPLATFQPGDFRLEITITDKVSGKILKKSVDFSVS